MTVDVRAAIKADLKSFYGSDQRVTQTVSAYVGLVDGEPVGIGGLVHYNGYVFAFLDVKPEGRRYKIAMVRTARRIMDEARRDGHRYIFAACDPNEPLAPKLLTSLGFRPAEDGTQNWRWSAE